MDVAEAFDDPSHRASEDAAFRAERAARRGDLQAARTLYAEAGTAELVVARRIPSGELRGVFAISAVTCFVRAQCWADAARTAHEFLARPDLLNPLSIQSIEDLLDDALRTRELFSAMGSGVDAAPLEIRLDGGRVRHGVCPSSLVQEREEIAEALVYRLADYKAQKKFRKAGRSAFRSAFTFYEVPARAGSYGIRFFVASSGQASLPGTVVTPTETVAFFLELAAAISASGAAGVRALVPDADYASAFIRAFRDMAPDGSAIGTVSFGSPGSIRQTERAVFTSDTRSGLSLALASATSADAFEHVGTLKSVNLRSRKITVVKPDESRVEMRLSGDHDDTIGPKLNRLVRATGFRVQKDDGTQALTASDVVLEEDGAQKGEG